MTSKELVKALRNCSDCYCGDCKYNGLMQPGNCVKCMNKLIDDAADEIIRLQETNNDLHETVQNLLEQFCSRPFELLPDLPRWVSVDERLPNQDELVLGRYKNGDMAVGHFSSNHRTPRNFLEKSNMWDDFFVGKRSDIAYWMPLPETTEFVIKSGEEPL